MTFGYPRRFGLWRLLAITLTLVAAVLALIGPEAVSAARHPGQGDQRGNCVRALTAGTRLQNVLDDLVADGSINSTQESAILNQFSDSRLLAGRQCAGMLLLRDGVIGEAVADLLGLNRTEIRSAWLDGQSLTGIASANGVERQELIDTIVDALGRKLDLLVERGRLSEERKKEILTNALPEIEREVDLHRGDLRDQAEQISPQASPTVAQ
jgi:hypothetical protein